MAVSAEDFRKALGHLAAGVAVVTTQLPSGAFAGITVTSFTSLSLSPPLVLVCIDKRAGLHDPLAIGQAFAVNLLADHQERETCSWWSASRFTAKACPMANGSCRPARLSMHTSTKGGDNDREVNEVTVIPANAPLGSCVVTTATPAAKCPNALRKSSAETAIVLRPCYRLRFLNYG